MGKISARMLCTIGTGILAVLIALGAFAGFATRNGEARPAIPRYGNVFQTGTLAGWASGAKISSIDSGVVEFDQIAHARQFVAHEAFEYGGQKMRILQVVQVDYPQGDAASGRPGRPDKTLLRVTARIQPSR